MISTDLITFLCAIGAVQGIVLAAVLLLARSGHRLANTIVAGLVMAIALTLLHRLAIHVGFWLEHPTFAFILNSLIYTWGPLLYLYTFCLTRGSLSHRQWLHFLPTVLVFLAMNLPLWLSSSTGQEQLIRHMWGNYPDAFGDTVIWGLPHVIWHPMITFKTHGFLGAVLQACYCALALGLIRDHNRRLEQHFSSLEQMNLRWLRVLSIAVLAVAVSYLLLNRIPFLVFGTIDRSTVGANLYLIALVLLLYGIAISALFQPSLISGVMQAFDTEPVWQRTQDQLPSPEGKTGFKLSVGAEDSNSGGEAVNAPPDHSAKYERARLGIEEAQRYKIRLMEVMEEQELYLDEGLTLPDLGRASGLSAPQISQVLNGQMNQNFFSFVNNYRIQLARRMLMSPETAGMPIVELAVEVGFKSKSSFYDAFKRATNMTPTQFKRAMEKPPEREDQPA
jgi:AraC-like DNA-binding protein